MPIVPLRKIVALFVFLAVVSLGPARAQTGTPYVLGAILTLTGVDADAGLSAASGLDVAVRHVNASGGVGGRPLQIRVLDDLGDPKRAVDLLHRLIGEHDVVGVLGDVDPNVSRALDSNASAAGVPFVSLVPETPSPSAPRDFVRLLPKGEKADRYAVSAWNAVTKIARELQSGGFGGHGV